MQAAGSEPDTVSKPAPLGVAVLGMSRSGTSAVAGLLRDAGFYLGPEEALMPANEYNPLGYNENLRIFSENERILAQAGGSWFDPPDRQALQALPEGTTAARALVLALAEEATGAPIVVKDPRIGVLLPVWTPVIDDLLHMVLVVRDPVEIALSLAHREGIPVPTALAGWEVHTAGLLGGLAGREVTIVRYEEILSDAGAAQRTTELVTLELDAQLRKRVSAERAHQALAPDLRHHSITGEQHHEQLTGSQQDLWEFLDSLPAETIRLDPPRRLTQPTQGAREAVRTEAGRESALREIRRLQAELGATLDAAEQRAAGLEDRLASVQAELQAAHGQLSAEREAALAERRQLLESRERAADEIARLSEALEAVTRSHSWRLTQPLREIGQQVRAKGRRD